MAGSRAWSTAFDVLFQTTPTPIVRRVRRRYGYGPIEEVVIRGRESGTDRHVFLVVARTADGWIVNHPNGERAAWVRNLKAAGTAEVVDRHGGVTHVRATLLPPGPERDAAIDEHTRQQVFGPKQMYAMARGYIREVGAVFMLEPLDVEDTDPVDPGETVSS